MTADNDIEGIRFGYSPRFNTDNIRRLLGLGGASPVDFPPQEKIRQMGMLVKAGAITSEEVGRIAKEYSLGVRLGSCPEHGRILFIKIKGEDAFVCPEPEHESFRTGYDGLPFDNRTR